MANTKTKITIGIIVAIGLAVLAAIYFAAKTPVVAGAVIEPNCNQITCYTSLGVSGSTYFATGFSQGGINSTSTPASMTLQASDIQNISLLSDTPTVGAITLTFPASSTLATWLPNAGDTASFIVTNATSSAFAVTLAGGTGTLLQKASTTAAILSGGSATVDVFRKANSDFVFVMNPAI